MTVINKTVREQQLYSAQNRAEGEVDPQTRLDNLRDALHIVKHDIKYCDNGAIPELGCMSEQHWAKCLASIDIALADLQIAVYCLRRGD